MTEESTKALGLIEGELAKVGTLPLSREWMYSAIRHCVRNMDFDQGDEGEEPDRYAGGPIGAIINALPDALFEVRELKIAAAHLVGQLDAMMPYIEKAIKDAWDKGDYINAPRLGAAIEALRLASADTRPEGGDSTEIEAPFTSGAVAESETPKSSRDTRKEGP